ncbi:MAG: hypothetical protein ACQKBT_08090 [Puniceicoccales bacterium]
MSRYPLGRISPHGSGGKSVYQRCASSVRTARSSVHGWLLGIGILIGVLSVSVGESSGVGIVIAIVLIFWGI